MFRLIFRAAAALCLLVSGFLLWEGGGLPASGTAWIVAYFGLFRVPAAAAVILAANVLLAVASACVTELLLGLFMSALSAVCSAACLLGMLGAYFPPLFDHLVKWWH